MRPTGYAILSLVLITSHSFGAAGDPVPNAVGFVVQERGSWFFVDPDRGRVAILIGQEVPARAAIGIAPPIEDGSLISIALYDGNLFVRQCAPKRSCERTESLPGVATQATLMERLKEAAAALFTEHERTAIAASRGAEPPVSEAVLRIAGGRPDLGPLYAGSPSGDYRLTLQKMNDRAQTVEEAREATVHVAGRDVVLETDLRITPGLYKVADHRSEEDPVWVLFADDRRYEALRGDFGAVFAASEKWSAILRSSMRTVRRAYLRHLAAGL